MLQGSCPGTTQAFYTFGDSRRLRATTRNSSSAQDPPASARLRRVAHRGERLGPGRRRGEPRACSTSSSYHGVSGTEFKRDPRDGRLKLMEVNAPPWLHHTLSTAAGVNLSTIAYMDAVGKPYVAPPQRDGVRWLDLGREARDTAAGLRRGQIRPLEVLSGFRGVRVDAVYALDDPAPAVRELASAVARDSRTVMRKVAERRS